MPLLQIIIILLKFYICKQFLALFLNNCGKISGNTRLLRRMTACKDCADHRRGSRFHQKLRADGKGTAGGGDVINEQKTAASDQCARVDSEDVFHVFTPRLRRSDGGLGRIVPDFSEDPLRLRVPQRGGVPGEEESLVVAAPPPALNADGDVGDGVKLSGEDLTDRLRQIASEDFRAGGAAVELQRVNARAHGFVIIKCDSTGMIPYFAQNLIRFDIW